MLIYKFTAWQSQGAETVTDCNCAAGTAINHTGVSAGLSTSAKHPGAVTDEDLLSGAHLAALGKYRRSQINREIPALSVTCHEISVADITRLSSDQTSHTEGAVQKVLSEDLQPWVSPPPRKAFNLGGFWFFIYKMRGKEEVNSQTHHSS